MGYTITKYHGRYNRSPRTQKVKYIVVHYVGGGTSKVGNAKNNCIYFSGGNRKASAHYFIDDGSIYEYADPLGYYTWHCGDGRGKYGISNSNSIGIEVCIDGDKPFTEQETKRLEWLVKKLMKDFNIPASNVVRHYDASRKECPYYYVKRPAKWKELHKRITGKSSSSATSSSSQTSKPTDSNSSGASKFPLPSGHWFGTPSSNDKNHSGYYSESERPHIKKIQSKVGVSSDGMYGPKTKEAVISYQKKNGLVADGLVGINTWNKMFK